MGDAISRAFCRPRAIANENKKRDAVRGVSVPLANRVESRAPPESHRNFEAFSNSVSLEHVGTTSSPEEIPFLRPASNRPLLRAALQPYQPGRMPETGLSRWPSPSIFQSPVPLYSRPDWTSPTEFPKSPFSMQWSIGPINKSELPPRCWHSQR